MVEGIKKSAARIGLFRWMQFLFGVFFLAAMLYIHVWVKELELWLFGFPAFLLGMDLTKIMKPK